MKLQTNKQQSVVLRENAPLLFIILAVFILGAVAIGVWHYLELSNSEQTIDQFKDKVNGLVASVEKKPSDSDEEENKETETKEEKELATATNPFRSPVKEIEKDSGKSDQNSSSSSSKNTEEGKVKERIAEKIKVLGLLGSSGKRLAIIKFNSDVQIVKPGDRISSLTIKDINQKRILAEEYGEELTYTFGGGQD